MIIRAVPNMPIGITMGCPASIGPEIIIKFYRDGASSLPIPPIIIGDANILAIAAAEQGLKDAIHLWQPGTAPRADRLNVFSVSNLAPGSVTPGRPSQLTGLAMASYVDTAIKNCLSGFLSAMVTCPISKVALNQAGFLFPGHTEMLAARTGTATVAMMLAGSRLRVVPVTIHCSIKQIAATLTQSAIVEQLFLTNQSLKNDFSISEPRIAVAALNPHGGEQGLFGTEEYDIITPAITRSINAGINASGPHPPDTVFYHAAAGRYDAVVCMYHDQGLIPFKLLHFDDGVNITLGLPIIRTSVDHGTAYDIAGLGRASHLSLKNASLLAAQFVANRATNAGGPGR